MNQADASALLEQCFDGWYSALLRYAHSLTGDLSLAEDMVQDVYLRLYRELRQGFLIENPKAWMFGVLRNDLSKVWRNDRRMRAVSDDDIDRLSDAVPPMELDSSLDADSDDIQRLFSVLTRREQEVMVLRLASLKYREIASRLGISASAVNALLARAIRKLRRAAKTRGWSEHANVATGIRPTLQ